MTPPPRMRVSQVWATHTPRFQRWCRKWLELTRSIQPTAFGRSMIDYMKPRLHSSSRQLFHGRCPVNFLPLPLGEGRGEGHERLSPLG